MSRDATPRNATPQEKEMAWDQIVSNAMATKLWADGQATFWAQPNAKELLFKLIFSGSIDNAFKKELHHQLKTGA